MDISVVKGEGGNLMDATRKKRKKKKKKKKSQRVVDDGQKRNDKDGTDDYDQGVGGWKETSRHQLM